MKGIFLKGLVVAIVTLAVDQASKAWILKALQDAGRPLEVLPFFHLTLVWNRGISFGMFSGMDMRLVLLGFTIAITLGVLVWLWRTQETRLSVPLGLIIGGACGNMLDRLRYGAVVDFLDVHAYSYHWPAFNVADSGIVLGVAMIAWHSMRS